MNQSTQLLRVRQLYELRERQSLAQLHEQKTRISVLKSKLHEIQMCVDDFTKQLSALDHQRSQASLLTVDTLQENAACRLIVERDLRKEQFYHGTATKDVSEATSELNARHALWRKHGQSLDALALIETSHSKVETQQALLVAERELDDLAMNRHRLSLHG